MTILARLFVVFLVANFLVEALAGVALITGPGGLQDAGQGEQWSMHYGFAALAIASASLWVWPHRADQVAVTLFLGITLTFHSGVFVSLTTAGDQAAGMVIHATFALVCALLLSTRGRWLTTSQEKTSI